MRYLILVALGAGTGHVAAQSTPIILVPGAELVYAANGTVTSTWRVDSIAYDLLIEGRTGCVRVRFAPGGPSPGVEERLSCAAGDTLFTWDAAGQRWRAARPIAPDRILEIPGRNRVNRYVTGAAREEQIGPHRVEVVETTVTTLDSTGVAIRRLRERYAPSLGTATWGVFETPDSATSGGWRVNTEFTLVEIRLPGNSP
jgi:hypothetical protein